MPTRYKIITDGQDQSMTAKTITLKAGSTTVAPLKFLSGALLTSPLAGAIEFLTDAFYGTITTGAARRTFAFLESPTFTGTVTSPAFIGGVQNLSGAGAANVTQLATAITTTGVGDAITLANGVSGQTKTIFHDVDGGSFVLTPTTKTGWTTFTSTVVGESITLLYTTTRGWIITGSYLGVIAP